MLFIYLLHTRPFYLDFDLSVLQTILLSIFLAVTWQYFSNCKVSYQSQSTIIKRLECEVSFFILKIISLTNTISTCSYKLKYEGNEFIS